MIILKNERPFAQGGNRLCFVDPTDSGRCIKVRRPDFSLEDMRRRKGFPHTLFPASRLDESRKEHAILQKCQAQMGDVLFTVLSRHHGFVDTDMGPGLCSELIRDADGRISLSVMQYVWENGLTSTLETALQRFQRDWVPLPIPARDLLLHNVVAQRDCESNIQRLVVIDGLGFSGLIPFYLLPRWYQIRRACRRIQRFRALIDGLLIQRKSGQIENPFWRQKHDGLDSQREKSP